MPIRIICIFNPFFIYPLKDTVIKSSYLSTWSWSHLLNYFCDSLRLFFVVFINHDLHFELFLMWFRWTLQKLWRFEDFLFVFFRHGRHHKKFLQIYILTLKISSDQIWVAGNFGQPLIYPCFTNFSSNFLCNSLNS